MPGSLGANPSGYLFRRTRRPNLWPYWEPERDDSISFVRNDEPAVWEYWDEDTMFDVLEVLFDLVSAPVDGR